MRYLQEHTAAQYPGIEDPQTEDNLEDSNSFLLVFLFDFTDVIFRLLNLVKHCISIELLLPLPHISGFFHESLSSNGPTVSPYSSTMMF